MSKKVYIAGKMRGVPYYNFPAFDKARDRLKGLGLEPLSPADMDRAAGFDPTAWVYPTTGFIGYEWNEVPPYFDLDAAIERDNKAIASADAVYVLHEGFEDSDGATKEVALAMRLGKTLVYDTMTDEGILRSLGTGGQSVIAPRMYVKQEDLRSLGTGGQSVIAPRMYVKQEDLRSLVTEGAKTFFTDPATGGRKETKLARFDLLPPDILWELAEHYGKGAAKYGERNMEKGYPFSKTYAACLRHLNQFWNGEDTDAETGSLHLIAAAWHCVTMAWFLRHGKGTDDRPNTNEKKGNA